MKAIYLFILGVVFLHACALLLPSAIYLGVFIAVALAAIWQVARYDSEPDERCFKCNGMFKKSEMHWTIATQMHAPRAFCPGCMSCIKQ